MFKRIGLCIAALALVASAATAQDRDTKVRNDRERFDESSFWVYNDMDSASESAKLLNKPMLVVFRCVP